MLASPKRPPPPSFFEPATPDRAAAVADVPPPSPPPLAVTTIDALSDDLLRHVFSFTGLLDSVVTVRRVCPRWRDAASPPTGRGALDAVVVAREPRIAARVSSVCVEGVCDVRVVPVKGNARACGGGRRSAPSINALLLLCVRTKKSPPPPAPPAPPPRPIAPLTGG